MICAGTSNEKATPNAKALGEAVKVWLKMLAPFAPFLCEELWSQTGEEGFISVANWPTFDAAKIDVAAEEQENLITDLMTDTIKHPKSHEDNAQTHMLLHCCTMEMAGLPQNLGENLSWRSKNRRVNEGIRR